MRCAAVRPGGHDRRLPAPSFAARELAQTRVERGELAPDPVDLDQQLLERLLCELIVEALAREPGAVKLGPRRLRLAEDPPVPQQPLEHPVTRRRPRAAQIITRAEQIAEPLELGGRGMHEPQHPGGTGPKLLRVAPVCLHPVARAERDQRRRHDIARHPELREQPPQREPATPRLVADRQPLRATERVDEPADRPLSRLDPADLRVAAIRRRDDREHVLIELDPPAHFIRVPARGHVKAWLVLHGRMRLWPCGPSTIRTSPRERCDARGPASCVQTDLSKREAPIATIRPGPGHCFCRPSESLSPTDRGTEHDPPRRRVVVRMDRGGRALARPAQYGLSPRARSARSAVSVVGWWNRACVWRRPRLGASGRSGC